MSGTVLTQLIFIPLIGAALLYLLPFFSARRDPNGTLARGLALIVTLATFLISVEVLLGFEGSVPYYQFTESYPWIPEFGITYALGVDGISIFLVMLTTVLMPIVVLQSASVHRNVRAYLAHMLVLETAMLGTLLSLDLMLFYVFWELMLFPMYFIIGIWGGKRRVYATLKFVLYTVIGSLLMLVSILYLVWRYSSQFGAPTFLLPDLLSHANLTLEEEVWLFAAFALAFGIKVPVFPFHTWLPDAHVEAPTGGSVILAGVLLKMGLYGFIRFAYPLFPNGAEAWIPLIVVLAVVGIVYGALVAWAQTDIKKLVAYSSVSHLGYCVLGFFALNSISTSGSIYQMINHGVSTGALFLLVGVLYDRKHTRAIEDYKGLAGKVPVFAFLFLVFTLSSIALPLTNGFVGEFLILSGSFERFPWLTIVAVSGVILGAVYMLSLYRRTMFGELNEQQNGDLTDVTKAEFLTFAPLLVLVFFMGLLPQPFLNTMEPTIKEYLASAEERKEALLRGTPSILVDRDRLGALAI